MNKTKREKPKIGYCAAFKQGYEIIDFVLKNSPNNIDFVATCNKDDSNFKSEIVKICNDSKVKVIENINGNEDSFIAFLKDSGIDIVILLWWPNIIKSSAINAVNEGWINLHPSLLPYGRGKHGYFWSIVEENPFGVSIHYIDNGIDTGPILFQKQIDISFMDTGESLYKKSSDEIINLFKENYNRIISLDFIPLKQNEKNATSHFAYEIEERTKIDLNKKYKAIELINILRARTFLNGPSVKVNKDGENYLLRLQIEKIKEDSNK